MPEQKVGVLGASSLVGGCLLAQLEEMGGLSPSVVKNVRRFKVGLSTGGS